MTDHYIDMVNEKDEVVGKKLKSLKENREFISRAAAIFICDSNWKFLVCKRGPHKKSAANLYDLAACGNVIAGETYEDAAYRELKEELSISCPLRMLDKFYQEIEDKGKTSRFFCGVFLGISDEEPKLSHEISEFKKMGFDEIEKEIQNHPESFCPGFINDFNQVRLKLKEIVKIKAG